jgi:hypothetical protein
MNPEDHLGASESPPGGRPLRAALAHLADAAPPDPNFADDMEDILRTIGTGPADPWAPF